MMKATAWLAGMVLVSAFIATPALSQSKFAPGLFDKPSNVRKIPPKPGSSDSREVTCTYFPDVMIRVVSDGPTAEKAALVRGANPPCNANKLAGELTLDTDDMYFAGRKGAALVFFFMDSHGTSPFAVIDAQSGKAVLKDGTTGDAGLQSASFEQGGLRLRYRRSVNANLLPHAGGLLGAAGQGRTGAAGHGAAGPLTANLQRVVPKGKIAERQSEHRAVPDRRARVRRRQNASAGARAGRLRADAVRNAAVPCVNRLTVSRDCRGADRHIARATRLW